MKSRALIGLLCAALLMVATAVHFAGSSRIETDLLALLPKTERNPLAEAAATRLGRLSGERAVFLIGLPEPREARAATAVFAARLAEGNAFRAVVSRIPSPDPAVLLGLYEPYRMGLLTAQDHIVLEDPHALAARIEARLSNPFGARGALPLASDPFGLFDDWLAELPLQQLRLTVEDGWLSVSEGGTSWLLVSAELAGSAFDPQVQAAAEVLLLSAETELRQSWPHVQVLRSGALFHATAARSKAESEVRLIGLGSLCGVVILLLLAYRSVRPLMLGLLSVAVGLCAGALATSLAFGQLHLMTMVFGASLIGESIDYAIQYCAARQRAGRDWDPRRGLASVLPALRIALATSVVGYVALGLTPFPALRQIAVFALAGLVAAWLTVVLVMPWLLAPPQDWTPGRALNLAGRWLDVWRTRVTMRRFVCMATVLLVVALPGWLQLEANDDVRQLIQSPPEVVAQEARLRALTGVEAGSQFFLIEADDAEQLLQREASLARRLDEMRISLQATSRFVPACGTQMRNQRHMQATAAGAQRALHDAGFRPEAVASWLAAVHAPAECLTPQKWLESPLSTPFRHLWLGDSAEGVAALAVPGGYPDVAALEVGARDLDGVTVVDKPGSVSRLFAEYRRLGGIGLGAATAVIFGLLAWRYGPWGAVIVLTPTVLAQALVLGILGHAGMALTLFNVLALILILGVGINYAIFLVEGYRRGDEGRQAAALTGVMLSAATTLLAFGLLSLSSMPALAGFGTTLALGIALAVFIAPVVLIPMAGKEDGHDKR